MLNLTNYPTDRFSPVYQKIVNSTYNHPKDVDNIFILEGTEKLIKEELVRCIWFGQHIKKDGLYTEDGLRLEVLSPGRWNSEGGPDFKSGEILLEGKGLVKGNIEVHVYASDWTKHQHDKQESYNTVCLHVIMWNDSKECFIKNSSGNAIPQLTLSKYLNAELDDIVDIIAVESYLKGAKVNPGHCKTEMENQQISEQWIGQFLDYAGDERILQKSKRYEKWLEKNPFEQTCYEAVMESLGYKNNKEPFLKLASLMPLKEIRNLVPEDAQVQEKKIYIQALLLGMAGLLPQYNNSKTNYDNETMEYIKAVENKWNAIKTKIGQIPMIKNDWTYAGIRPANYPERRIVAIANILSESPSCGIFRRILSVFQKIEDYKDEQKVIKGIIDEIQSIFLDVHEPYWSYHYKPGGKKLEKPQKLIGNDRALTIFVNVIIPVFLAYARRHNDIKLEKILHLAYRNYTPPSTTSVTRFMLNRIMGKPKISNKVINSARRQQGLYQIFKDFCENNNISCNKCALYLSMIKTGNIIEKKLKEKG